MVTCETSCDSARDDLVVVVRKGKRSRIPLGPGAEREI